MAKSRSTRRRYGGQMSPFFNAAEAERMDLRVRCPLPEICHSRLLVGLQFARTARSLQAAWIADEVDDWVENR